MTKLEYTKAGLALMGQKSFVNTTAEWYARNHTKEQCRRFYYNCSAWVQRKAEHPDWFD